MDNNMKNGKTIFIGTPAYEGKVHVQYALALMDTSELLKSIGYDVIVRMPIGGSLLVADRNRLIELFWQSGADYMLCVDSDLAWEPQAVMRFLQTDKDFCAGVYPARQGKNFTFRPFLHEDGRIVMCEKTKLLKMQYIPAGFMLFKREVIAKMRETYPELKYEPKSPRTDDFGAHCFFNTEVYEGEFWGEDYVFCRRAREAGFDIWVDPTINFNHAGICGALIETLTDDPEKADKVTP
jgi:hypothetical protein